MQFAPGPRLSEHKYVLGAIYNLEEIRVIWVMGVLADSRLVRACQGLAGGRVGTVEPSGAGLCTPQSLLPDPASAREPGRGKGWRGVSLQSAHT